MKAKDDLEVGPDGQVEEVKEITDTRLIVMLEKKIKKFPNNRFVYRVFMRKNYRNLHLIKQDAIVLVKECISKKQSHSLRKEPKCSTLFKHVYYCSFDDCPFKSMIMLICEIGNGLNDDTDIQSNYLGFMLVVGYSGTHRVSTFKEFYIMEGYEKSEELLVNHQIPRNNLKGLPIVNKKSCYKNPLEVKLDGDRPQIKFNLIEIPEIKQIIRAYINEKETYDPTQVLSYVTTWILKLQKVFNQDQVEVMNKLFAEVMLDLWSNVLFEDKHKSYENMAVDEHSKEQSLCFNFESESGIKEKKLLIQVKCWDIENAKLYLNSTWKNFCKVANKINEQNIHPWILPSIQFTANSKAVCEKKIHNEAKVPLEELEASTYRKGRKETVKDRQLKQMYGSLANIMQVDITTKDANFKTVPEYINAEKAILKEKVDEAKIEMDKALWVMRDASEQYSVAKARFNSAENNLKSNDDAGKHWKFLGPTVITKALQSQRVKVDQCNKFVGVQAQLNRCDEVDKFNNQFNQAKDKYLAKFEDCDKSSTEIDDEETEEDYGKRIKQTQEAEKQFIPLRNRKNKGKKSLKSFDTPGMEEKLKVFKEKMKIYRGATIIMNPQNGNRIEFLPKIEETKKGPVGMQQRNTSQVIQTEKLKEVKKIESPRNIRNSYSDALQKEVETGVNNQLNQEVVQANQ